MEAELPTWLDGDLLVSSTWPRKGPANSRVAHLVAGLEAAEFWLGHAARGTFLDDLSHKLALSLGVIW